MNVSEADVDATFVVKALVSPNDPVHVIDAVNEPQRVKVAAHERLRTS